MRAPGCGSAIPEPRARFSRPLPFLFLAALFFSASPGVWAVDLKESQPGPVGAIFGDRNVGASGVVSGPPSFVTRSASAPAAAGGAQGLLADRIADLSRKAGETGPVRVIVGLRTPFSPEGTLGSLLLLRDQRRGIARAQDALLASVSAVDPASVRRYESIPYVAMELGTPGLQDLLGNPHVASVEEDVLHVPLLLESVPLIGAPAAWAAGFDGTGQTVAVLDTGVDKAHPFLTGKVVSEACYSTTNTSLSSVCPGAVSESTAAGSGVACTAAGCDHGTHVAGAVAGKGSTFSGVAPGANVIAIQVFSRVKSCSSSVNCIGALTSDVLKGLERVLALSSSFPIASVNMSLGGPGGGANCDQNQGSYKAIIDNLRSAGIATVVAAGNDGNPGGLSSPACISTAVSVGSTGDGSSSGSSTSKVDAVSSFSNSASFLSLLAPGEWINSSVPDSKYKTVRGTSQASPHVAGAFAVLKQKTPGASVGQILQALATTGLSVNDTRNGIVKPRIRVDAAVSALASSPCALSVSPLNPTVPQSGGTGTLTVTAPAGCAWVATSNVPWLTVTSGSGGSGGGSVGFSAAPNTSIERSGTLVIGGQVVVVDQAGVPVLAVDDGRFEDAVGLTFGGTLWVVNRLTPPAYPVTVNAVALYFMSGTGVTVGDSITILSGINPTGASSIDGIKLQTLSASVKALDQYNVYAIPGLAVGSGDFVIGVKVTHSSGEFPIAVDKTGSKGRSYTSVDGADFTSYAYNFGFRAVVAQSLVCPTIAGMDPASATSGTKVPVTLTGSGYSGVTGLKFTSNVTSAFTIDSETRLSTALPDVAVTGPITLSKPDCALVESPVFAVAPCLDISPGSQVFLSTGGTGRIDVTAVSAVPGCAWTVSSDSSWITVSSATSGAGSGSVSFTVASTSLSTGRKGTLTIGGRAFTVLQAGSGGSCATLPIVPGQLVNGSLDGPDCPGSLKGSNRTDRYSFTAVAGQEITLIQKSTAFDAYLGLFDPGGKLLVSDDNGGGGKDAKIQTTLSSGGTYTLEATCATAGSGSYTLDFTAVIPGCTYDINPKSQTVPGPGGSGTVSVSATSGCAWAAGTDAPWVTLGAGSTGSGNGTVTFSAAANATVASRTAFLGIAGNRFTVTQPPCLSVSPSERVFDSRSGTGTVDVTAAGACGTWTAMSDVYWMSVTSGPTGTGSATVRFSYWANDGSTGRRGTLRIAGFPVTVYQAAPGGDCAAKTIAPGQTVNGTLRESQCPGVARSYSPTDRYTFEGRAGQQVEIVMKTTLFDSYLGLVDPSGNILKTASDLGSATESRLQFVLTSSGTHVVEASGYYSDEYGAYTLSLAFQRLLLQGEKVAVQVAWKNQYNGQTGTGGAIPKADKYGFIYFSDQNNPEVFVKVLDFGASSPYLLFWAGLTDFEYTVTFTNLVTGAKTSFLKPAGSAAGGADTTKLPHARAVFWDPKSGGVTDLLGGGSLGALALAGGWTAGQEARPEAVALAQLSPGPAAEGETLLAKGQIAVSVTWRSQYSGQTGQAIPIPQKDEFCFFYFSDRENPEVFVKALDWGAPTPYKIFAAGLTDFEYTVTFRNVKTGASVVFKKEASLYDGYAANMDR